MVPTMSGTKDRWDFENFCVPAPGVPQSEPYFVVVAISLSILCLVLTCGLLRSASSSPPDRYSSAS